MRLLLLSFFILTSFLCHSQETKQLRFAFEIFRHGARSPHSNLNSTFHDWFGFKWEGLKELTPAGFRQHYLIGSSNRIRYMNETSFLSQTYNSKELLVISTDTNRTILSANAQLQGLYPPGTGPNLTQQQQINAVPPNDPSTYQTEQERLGNSALPNHITIIPVHSFFKNDHYIQLQDKKVCPGVIEHYIKFQNFGPMKDFLEELEMKYGKDIEKVAPNFKEEMFLNYDKAYSILDDVIASYVDGRNLTILNTGNITQEKLLEDAYKFFLIDFIMTEKIRNIIGEISMSPIFYQIIEWMNKKIELDKEGLFNYTGYDMPKFVMYSGHDTTVAAFSYFMELIGEYKELKYPFFASHANLELVKYGNNVGNDIEESDYVVNFYFDDYYISSINYVEFRKKVKKKLKTTKQIERFCDFPDKDTSNTYLILIAIIFILIDILFIAGIIYIWMFKCKYLKSKKGILLD